MARLSIEEWIEQLEARKKALKARLSKHDRARDTRRKVLLGALVLNRLDNDRDAEFSRRLGDWLRRELPGFLTREEDKKLFPEFVQPGSAAPAPNGEHRTAPDGGEGEHGASGSGQAE